MLNVGEFSLPIKASQKIEPKRSSASSSYILPSLEISDLSVEIFFPSTAQKAQISEFEDLLSDYCAFASDDTSHLGQIEIMNEDGEVIGVVISKGGIEEDPDLKIKGHEKDPVLLELPPRAMEQGKESEVADQRILKVTRASVSAQSAASSRDNHWMITGAQYVSSGLVKGSSLISRGLNSAADSYSEYRNVRDRLVPESRQVHQGSLIKSPILSFIFPLFFAQISPSFHKHQGPNQPKGLWSLLLPSRNSLPQIERYLEIPSNHLKVKAVQL